MTAAPALLAVVGLAGVAVGIWLTLVTHRVATRHRPPVCLLASAPVDAPEGLARLLAAEVRPTAEASTPSDPAAGSPPAAVA